MSITINKQMTVEEARNILASLPSGKLLNASKHCGILKLREDPLAFQKRLRSEWD